MQTTSSTLVRYLADNLTYKPGWTFKVARGGLPELRIGWTAPNSYPTPTEPTVSLSVALHIPDSIDLEAALELVAARIEGVERHERAEWLRFDGECLDPEAHRAHPGGAYMPRR